MASPWDMNCPVCSQGKYMILRQRYPDGTYRDSQVPFSSGPINFGFELIAVYCPDCGIKFIHSTELFT